MQLVTCVSSGWPVPSLGKTDVTLVPLTLARRPDSSPTHNAPPADATQVGTVSLGKLLGFGSRHSKWLRIEIFPVALTESRVLEPASAIKVPLLVANTPYGLASCSCVPGLTTPGVGWVNFSV